LVDKGKSVFGMTAFRSADAPDDAVLPRNSQAQSAGQAAGIPDSCAKGNRSGIVTILQAGEKEQLSATIGATQRDLAKTDSVR